MDTTDSVYVPYGFTVILHTNWEFIGYYRCYLCYACLDWCWLSAMLLGKVIDFSLISLIKYWILQYKLCYGHIHINMTHCSRLLYAKNKNMYEHKDIRIATPRMFVTKCVIVTYHILSFQLSCMVERPMLCAKWRRRKY